MRITNSNLTMRTKRLTEKNRQPFSFEQLKSSQKYDIIISPINKNLEGSLYVIIFYYYVSGCSSVYGTGHCNLQG